MMESVPGGSTLRQRAERPSGVLAGDGCFVAQRADFLFASVDLVLLRFELLHVAQTQLAFGAALSQDGALLGDLSLLGVGRLLIALDHGAIHVVRRGFRPGAFDLAHLIDGLAVEEATGEPLVRSISFRSSSAGL